MPSAPQAMAISSYRNYIIDAMYRLTPAALEKGAKYEVR